MDGMGWMDALIRAGLRALLFGLNTLLGLVSLLRALPFPILVAHYTFPTKKFNKTSVVIAWARPRQL